MPRCPAETGGCHPRDKCFACGCNGWCDGCKHCLVCQADYMLSGRWFEDVTSPAWTTAVPTEGEALTLAGLDAAIAKLKADEAVRPKSYGEVLTDEIGRWFARRIESQMDVFAIRFPRRDPIAFSMIGTAPDYDRSFALRDVRVRRHEAFVYLTPEREPVQPEDANREPDAG